MRFRRKPHRARSGSIRRTSMKGDWILLAHTDCLLELPDAQPCLTDEYTDAGVFFVALVDSQDLARKEDSLTVMRMVGEISVLATAPAMTITGSDFAQGLIQVDEMIYKSAVSEDGLTSLVVDPRRGQTMELDGIMWRRRTHISVEWATPVPAIVLPMVTYDPQEAFSPHLDVRVKRRLVFGENLYYAVGCTMVQDNAANHHIVDTAGLRLSMNMRGYVKF